MAPLSLYRLNQVNYINRTARAIGANGDTLLMAQIGLNASDCIQLGILLVAVFTMLFSQYNIVQQNKLMIFSEYTRRYQEIFLNMPDDIYDGTAKVDERTKRHIRLYFDLCSEEYHLWKKHTISKNIWRIWVKGMRISLRSAIYRTAWDNLKTEYDENFRNYFEREVVNCQENQ